MNLFLVGIEAENAPGTLARISRRIAEHGVNLQGFMTSSDGIQMLTKDIHAARRALDSGAFNYNVTEVHEVILENRPGALASVCERLFEAGINIETAFGLTLGNDGRVFINVSDLERAAPIIAAISKGDLVNHPGLHRVAPVGSRIYV